LSVGQTGKNVFAVDLGISDQDIVDTVPGAQKRKHRLHRNPRAPNHGLSVAYFRVNFDPMHLKNFYLANVVTQEGRRNLFWVEIIGKLYRQMKRMSTLEWGSATGRRGRCPRLAGPWIGCEGDEQGRPGVTANVQIRPGKPRALRFAQWPFRCGLFSADAVMGSPTQVIRKKPLAIGGCRGRGRHFEGFFLDRWHGFARSLPDWPSEKCRRMAAGRKTARSLNHFELKKRARMVNVDGAERRRWAGPRFD